MELVYAETVLTRNARMNAAMNPMMAQQGGMMQGAPGMPGAGPGMPGAGMMHPGMNQQQGGQMMMASQQLAQQTANAPGGLIMDPKQMMQLQQRNTGGNVGMSNDMKVSELFDYVRDRNQWLDQRFSEMDKRFERVDRNCGALVIWMDQSKKKDTAEREKGTKSTKNAAESGTDWRRIRKLEDQVDALQGQNERILELLERQQYRDPPAFRGGSTGFGTGGSPMRR
mmetsp:Transcript_3523/g.8345  ORF Transcript_3523/g.8345 Transcript_3523/m.8345 type:complete len:226 (+) Transcript_3523:780-1457(+)